MGSVLGQEQMCLWQLIDSPTWAMIKHIISKPPPRVTDSIFFFLTRTFSLNHEIMVLTVCGDEQAQKY